MNREFDLIVLGSGSAARDGANKARKEFGANVALVEQTRWGGNIAGMQHAFPTFAEGVKAAAEGASTPVAAAVPA